MIVGLKVGVRVGDVVGLGVVLGVGLAAAAGSAADVVAKSSSLGPHALNATATIIKAKLLGNIVISFSAIGFLILLSRHLVGVLIIFGNLGC